MINQRWLKDNLEAIAIAVVMALVIRQFAVEAFKIPTESMAPTLFGERRGLSGDRILVDKIGPMLGGYRRFDVHIHGLEAAPDHVSLDGVPQAVSFDRHSGTASLPVAASSWRGLTVQ